MATKPKACVGRVHEEGAVPQGEATQGKTKNRAKREKKRDKQRDKGRGEMVPKRESRNDRIGHIIEADFQLSNIQKLQQQLAHGEKSAISQPAAAAAATDEAPVLDQQEAKARIVAAEAMSVLASGLVLAPQGQASRQRELSPASVSSRGSTTSDEALVISLPNHDSDTPTTTGRDLQPGDYVQEDTVSSSSTGKHQIRTKQSPVISSILENGRSNYCGVISPVSHSVVNHTESFPCKGRPSPWVAAAAAAVPSPVEVKPVPNLIQLHSQAKTSETPKPAHSERQEIQRVINTGLRSQERKFVVSLTDEYFPPQKRSRTIETQTGNEAMDIENSETIPDLHNLSLHPVRASTCPVTQASGGPTTQPGSGQWPSSAERENTRLPEIKYGAQPQVISDRKMSDKPNGLSPVQFYPHQRQTFPSMSSKQGTLKASTVKHEQLTATQVGASGSVARLARDGLKPPLPHSILTLPRKQAPVPSQRPVVAPPPTSSPSPASSSTPGKAVSDATDQNLQTAQQQALQRLSDNLARASPKERAFMLGQIQAIVTLQRASQLGQNAQGMVPSLPITPTPHITLSPGAPMRVPEPHTVGQSPATIGGGSWSNLRRPLGTSAQGDGKSQMDFPQVSLQQGGYVDNGQCPVAEGVSPLPQTVQQLDNSVTLGTSPHHINPNLNCLSSASYSPAVSPSPLQNSDYRARGQLSFPDSSLIQVKKNSQHAQHDTSGSHLPFKKRRMAEYPSETANLSHGSVISAVSQRGSESLSPIPVATVVSRVSTASEPRVCSPHIPHNPRVPGLSDIQTALRKDEDGDIPLHIAAAQGNLAAVEKYIALLKLADSPVDVINKDRQTPLHIAVVTEDNEVVKRLLRAGANVNRPNSIGQTAIHLATKGGCNQCLTSLITGCNGPHLDKKDFEGYSPLHLAVQRGHMNVIHTLLDHGADTNVQDGKSGRTPLFHAAENNQIEIVDMLLKAQAKVNVMNYAGNTAVMAASSRAHKEVVTLLMQYGADTKGTNIGDMTSKGPPVRSSTNAALRQTVSTPSPSPSPTPDSDDSHSEGRRQEKSGRNRNGIRKNKSKKSPV